MTELSELPLLEQMNYLSDVLESFQTSLSKANDYGSICFKIGEMKSTLLMSMFHLRQKLGEEKRLGNL